ncbi:MAG TPA: hypothetical protein VMF13_13050 [Luteitalea sp.]|nr:hypothetical protein [Luteitalea sp.]
MHLGVASPVVDLFTSGEVPREVRLLAARGLVTSEGCDRLALLALMTEDLDASVSSLAAQTVAAIPVSALAPFLGRTDVPEALRAWYAARRDLLPSLVDGDGVERRLAPRPDAPMGDDELEVEGAAPEVIAAIDAATETEEEEVKQLLSMLPVPDKIKIATLGRREQRAILIRDPNRVVATAVLASPKLTEVEIENFARMQNVSEEVLRIIGSSRAWVKSYNVIAALVKNSRTPPSVSLPLMARLNERDVKGLIVNRNLPESVRLAARRFIEVQQERRS